MEIWKAVDGFPDYEVSNIGGFRKRDGDGYKELMVSISGCSRYYMVNVILDDGRVTKKYLHRLIGQTFLPNPNPDLYDSIGLKNKDGHDCRVENLYWTNQKELMAMRKEQDRYAKGSDHHLSRMTEEKVIQARSLYQTGKMRISEIARKFGMDSSTMDSIVKGTTWKHVK